MVEFEEDGFAPPFHLHVFSFEFTEVVGEVKVHPPVGFCAEILDAVIPLNAGEWVW